MSKALTTPDFSTLIKTPSPVVHLDDKVARQAGVSIYVKRDDLLHPEFGGNKWRKLKYNLQACCQQQASGILTFGGAYSNHLLATAAAGAASGIPTIGIVRGEPASADNPTLRRASALGMQLQWVDRATYRQRHSATYWQDLRARYGEVYIVPEGGSNVRALAGVAELVVEMRAQLPRFDVICCPVGSGGTLAGIVGALAGAETAMGISVLRGADYLVREVERLLGVPDLRGRWQINDTYHCGGYARVTRDLVRFCDDFAAHHGIPLEPIYSGKMMYGIFDLISRRRWPPETVLVALHTGGLQGLAGMENRLNALRAGGE